ncbi:MAG: hypothetical protein P1U80_05450 [Pseudomonadales bacterium]|nr:hypothetical protein [Pseudomonadales bacterium]
MKTPTIIDVEASGFGAGSYPIEIGFVLPDGATTCFLIKPLDDWTHWDSAAEQIHGIRRESLGKLGRTVTEAAQLLNDQLAGRIVYSDGWSNDLSWLGLLFECSGTPQRFKLESLRAILDEQQITHWHDTREQVQLELNLERHRASADARILQLTYLRTYTGTAI